LAFYLEETIFKVLQRSLNGEETFLFVGDPTLTRDETFQ